MKKLFLIAIAVLATVIAFGVHEVSAPGPLAKSRIIFVPRGSGVATMASTLEKDGIIRSGRLYRYYVRFVAPGSKLRAGEFEVPAGASLADVVSILDHGKIYARKVTVPEGVTNWYVLEALKKQEYLTGDVTKMPEEGTLLPDTYFYIRGDTRQSMIDRMQAAHHAVLAELEKKYAPPAPLKNIRQLVTLASIIEEESVPGEQTRVAGVFINRLRQGMRLQTDPTIIYGLTGGAPLGRSLTYADKRSQTAYNTYVIDGLPPTPIANPGREALEAAFHPERHGYLYFVADGKGGSVFATTLDQHNANVRAYLAWLRTHKPDAKGGKMWREAAGN